jgi:hypothetical protein
MRCNRHIILFALGLLAAGPLRATGVVAVPLPDPGIQGFHFPESEATILTWVHDMNSGGSAADAAFTNLHLHGWGLWTALTLPTNQVDGFDRLRVFETWYTPQEFDGQFTLHFLNSAPSTPASAPQETDAPVSPRAAASVAPRIAPAPRVRSALQNFVQFEHGLQPRDRELLRQQSGGSETVFGYVKFDPTAAAHVMQQNLLSTAALNQLVMGGAQQIPVFPSTSITLKSAFQVISAKTLVDGRYYRLNVWSGPPATPQAYPQYLWPGVVWIDIQGGGSGAGLTDTLASTDGGTRTDQTTYPISSIINHQMTPVEAAQFRATDPGTDAKAGDYVILVAMHVAGREITRWTWQTFWWTPTPDDPKLPSSTAIAGLRPSALTGAARNYAMAIGYDMTTPSQPNVGGQNAGDAIYTYNPYLEARFGPENLTDSLPGDGPDGKPSANNVGVNCNCMSCHVRANYNPNNLATAPEYAGARYTDLNDPQFAGTLQVDFLWSLPEMAQ